MERGLDKRKLAKYQATEITLADEQHTQMCNVMDIIDKAATNDLQRIFEEWCWRETKRDLELHR